MLENYTAYRILKEFFDSPKKGFYMREISRRTSVSNPSVLSYLRSLTKERLIIKEKEGLYPTYKANTENPLFKALKKQDLVINIINSGLIKTIEKETMPNCIVLFGSGSRGEDTKGSDIDLFVQAREKEINLKKYENILRRKINILFEGKISSLSRELLNNIVNGQVLYGHLTL